jgi:hypothetical protein
MRLRHASILLATFVLEAHAADAPEVIAARDFVHCSAWYTLAASSAGAEAEKKRRTDVAIAFGDGATILTDANFSSSEYKKAHARILAELKSDPEPDKTARRALDFCALANEKHQSLLLARIKQRNEQIRKAKQ